MKSVHGMEQTWHSMVALKIRVVRYTPDPSFPCPFSFSGAHSPPIEQSHKTYRPATNGQPKVRCYDPSGVYPHRAILHPARPSAYTLASESPSLLSPATALSVEILATNTQLLACFRLRKNSATFWESAQKLRHKLRDSKRVPPQSSKSFATN